MKILIIGNGAREHAIAYKVRQSPAVTRLFCAPGNPGTAKIAENINIPATEINQLCEFAKQEQIDLTIVGPEIPLSLGVVDCFIAAGLRIVGPTKAAAQIECSKNFAKKVMTDAGVPTAAYQTFHEKAAAIDYVRSVGAPIVVKADGLAAGKGVVVATTVEAAVDHIEKCFPGNGVVIEQYLDGVEASFIVATDGTAAVALPCSNDYKRLLDNHKGPNTGGMGTISPTPNITTSQEAACMETVIMPTLRALSKAGTPFKGFLYAGMMISEAGLHVIEFNCRLGDPETQVIMRRLDSDFVELCSAISAGELNSYASKVRHSSNAAVCVVLAAANYPETPRSGDIIYGIEQAMIIPGVEVFHAGTTLNSRGQLVTAGGRVLSVTATGRDLTSARSAAYRAVDLIQFAGMQVRRDI